MTRTGFSDFNAALTIFLPMAETDEYSCSRFTPSQVGAYNKVGTSSSPSLGEREIACTCGRPTWRYWDSWMSRPDLRYRSAPASPATHSSSYARENGLFEALLSLSP